MAKAKVTPKTRAKKAAKKKTTKQQARAKLEEELQEQLDEYEELTEQLAALHQSHRNVIDLFLQYQNDKASAETNMKALAKRLASADVTGYQTLASGTRFDFAATVTRKRVVSPASLIAQDPDLIEWDGLFKVDLKAFDAAVAASAIDLDDTEIGLGKPEFRTSLKLRGDL